MMCPSEGASPPNGVRTHPWKSRHRVKNHVTFYPRLTRCHEALRKCDAHPSPHDFQEDAHSAVVIEVLEFPNEVSKRPRSYSDYLALSQVEVELDVPFWIGSRHQALDDATRDWLRLTAVGN